MGCVPIYGLSWGKWWWTTWIMGALSVFGQTNPHPLTQFLTIGLCYHLSQEKYTPPSPPHCQNQPVNAIILPTDQALFPGSACKSTASLHERPGTSQSWSPHRNQVSLFLLFWGACQVCCFVGVNPWPCAGQFGTTIHAWPMSDPIVTIATKFPDSIGKCATKHPITSQTINLEYPPTVHSWNMLRSNWFVMTCSKLHSQLPAHARLREKCQRSPQRFQRSSSLPEWLPLEDQEVPIRLWHDHNHRIDMKWNPFGFE